MVYIYKVCGPQQNCLKSHDMWCRRSITKVTTTMANSNNYAAGKTENTNGGKYFRNKSKDEKIIVKVCFSSISCIYSTLKYMYRY